jgi:hypothetical protein
MKMIDFPIERINKFLNDHIFEIPTMYGESLKTNVKVKLTGVKDYISVGEKYPHIEYTMYILPTNESSDIINSLWASKYGSDMTKTSYGNEYYQYVHQMSRLLMDFLKIFNIDSRVICTRVINEVKSDKFKNL